VRYAQSSEGGFRTPPPPSVGIGATKVFFKKKLRFYKPLVLAPFGCASRRSAEQTFFLKKAKKAGQGSQKASSEKIEFIV
jgi:hypothetical protein